MTLRLKPDIHERATAEAKARGVSINALVALALDDWLRWQERGRRKAERGQLSPTSTSPTPPEADVDADLAQQLDRLQNEWEESDVVWKEQRLVATRTGPKVGRNEPCPCGSGQKYKRCHGARE